MKLSEIIAAWENGETIEQQQHSNSVWKEWAPYSKYTNGSRGFDYTETAIAFSDNRLRIKPSTLTINGIEFPEPHRKPLSLGEGYYLVTIANKKSVESLVWAADSNDYRWLECGLIQLTKEGAEKQAEAMLSLLKPKE